MTLDT